MPALKLFLIGGPSRAARYSRGLHHE